MFWQIEVAKLTLVLRNFPDWMSVQDRELTRNQALRDAGLSHVEWDLATTQKYDGQGEPRLSKVSILHVPTYGARKKLMEASDRLTAWYWEEEKSQSGQGGDSQPRSLPSRFSASGCQLFKSQELEEIPLQRGTDQDDPRRRAV